MTHTIAGSHAVRLPESPEVEVTVNRLLDKLQAHASANFERATYYDMHRYVKSAAGVVPEQYYKLGLVLGWTAKGVDSLRRRCNLDGFTWAGGDLGSLGFDASWEFNRLNAEVPQALTSSLIHSPSFVVNVRGEDGEPAIYFRDASVATGEWNSRLRRLDNMLSVLDRDDDGAITEVALYEFNRTTTVWRDRYVWRSETREHGDGMPAEPLPYRPRLSRPFGSARITRAGMAIQDSAVRSLIRLEGHMDVYSFPEMWLLGGNQELLDNASSAWQVMLGRIKGIPDDDDAPAELARGEVKQFAGTNPTPHLSALNAYAKMFAREMSLPDTSLAITDMANPTSADAYDASQHELIAEAEGAIDDWSPAIRRAVVRDLAMRNGMSADQIPASWRSIQPRWRDARYQSKAAQADAGMKQITAAPWLAETEVGLELLGLSDQQIQRALAEKRRARGSEVLDALRQAASGGADAG